MKTFAEFMRSGGSKALRSNKMFNILLINRSRNEDIEKVHSFEELNKFARLPLSKVAKDELGEIWDEYQFWTDEIRFWDAWIGN